MDVFWEHIESRVTECSFTERKDRLFFSFLFFFSSSKKNEIPRKTRKHFGIRGNEVSVEDREQNVCRVNGTCFRAATTLSLSLSSPFPLSISPSLFLFLLREETLKHAPNRLMFKRARAFSWQQHLQPSIYVVFQSPEGRRISFRSTWKNQARFELVGKVGATEIL